MHLFLQLTPLVTKFLKAWQSWLFQRHRQNGHGKGHLAGNGQHKIEGRCDVSCTSSQVDIQILLNLRSSQTVQGLKRRSKEITQQLGTSSFVHLIHNFMVWAAFYFTWIVTSTITIADLFCISAGGRALSIPSAMYRISPIPNIPTRQRPAQQARPGWALVALPLGPAPLNSTDSIFVSRTWFSRKGCLKIRESQEMFFSEHLVKKVYSISETEFLELCFAKNLQLVSSISTPMFCLVHF